MDLDSPAVGEETSASSSESEILFDGTFFSKITSKTTNSSTVAACVKCLPLNVEVKGYKKCSSNFIKHLKRKHGPDCVEEYKSYCIQKKRKKPQSTSVQNRQVLKTSSSYSQEEFDSDVVKFFLHSMIPLSCVEDPHFIRILKRLHVDSLGLTIMSRTTLTRRINQHYDDQVKVIKDLMSRVNFICATADIWSSRKRSFLGLTAHWIDPDTFLRSSRALACRRFPGVHNYERITNLLRDILHEFDLDLPKIVAITTDNGSNFVKAFKEFGVHPGSIETNDNCETVSNVSNDDIEEEPLMISDSNKGCIDFLNDHALLPYHMRCCSHTLNLIATTDLKHLLTTDTALSNIHKSVIDKCNRLWKMANRPKSSEIIQNILGHNLSRPGETRWNSMYDALKQILSIKEKNSVLHEGLGLENPLRNTDFNYIEEYLSCLKPVAAVLDILQGENNTYYGLLLPTLLMLKKKVHALQQNNYQYCKPIAVQLLKQVQSRFDDLLKLTGPAAEKAIIAAHSYPRFKNSWYQCVDSEHHARLKNMFLTAVSEESQHHSNIEPEIFQHTHDFDDAFYDFSNSNSDSNTSGGSGGHSIRAEYCILGYLSDTSRSLDILNKYPEIKKVFLKYNTPLTSSAPVERLFSYATMTNTPKSNRLTDENFERRVILKANLNNEKHS
ncbi:uncharacterized protein LOC133534820 [Cydia pomonella]|uniref:uncharacterized protein LOC133515898 n=1 Tax=Cydia pomonella TaxID=82600 RepID=UPI002ADE17E6|nr:uncharacterized protein LOC133515898 [Cydia pomonella]XP_061704939.1 uncharacterized protein LOC133516172 [Cydia pomonella]XP_061711473.1 uncharacterized protein LOC133520816 [Cydia pomonella]XP_061712731.1 uncharacterized protein LOC133521660 [Cydia pomonella]XP_061715967.1 uncharacterized protein LOC133524129 [Cydia pomonella]XP_061716920.1 uncharacterized protein LOC133524793 [Cydia pomonella]XP_061721436.1 uncharacterized protein LOC133528187 [Cydia pomonella]XP_061722679.1 uncharacte